jgi:hypothetical protein
MFAGLSTTRVRLVLERLAAAPPLADIISATDSGGFLLLLFGLNSVRNVGREVVAEFPPWRECMLLGLHEMVLSLLVKIK